MIVYVKASIDGATPEFMFLDLVELESQRAADIEEALLNCLKTAGYSEEWLQKNWISFVSDGASVMLGKNTGVALRLTERYPNLFTWHCMNHRLELAVSDAVDKVQAVSHFKVFMKKIHNLYSQSNKKSKLCEEQAVNGMRDFLEHPDEEPESLKPLIRCMQTIPCSTAECKRGFSLMNNV